MLYVSDVIAEVHLTLSKKLRGPTDQRMNEGSRNCQKRYGGGLRIIFFLTPCPAASKAEYLTKTTECSLFVGVVGALAYSRQVVVRA